MTVRSEVIESVPIQVMGEDPWGNPIRLHADAGGHLEVNQSELVRGADYVYAHLTDSAGVADMAVNGSVTAVEYSYSPDVPAHISRLNFGLSDDAKAIPNGFFTIATLTNGLTIQLRDADGDVVQHFGTDVVPITTHARFAPLAGVDTGTDTVANVGLGAVRWTIAAAGEALLMLPSETLVVTVRDNLSAITELLAMIQGVKLTRLKSIQ